MSLSSRDPARGKKMFSGPCGPTVQHPGPNRGSEDPRGSPFDRRTDHAAKQTPKTVSQESVSDSPMTSLILPLLLCVCKTARAFQGSLFSISSASSSTRSADSTSFPASSRALSARNM